LILILLIYGSWPELLFNVPLAGFHISRILSKKHLYDPTKVFTISQSEKKYLLIKMAFYMLSFFFYLFRCISSLIEVVAGETRTVSYPDIPMNPLFFG